MLRPNSSQIRSKWNETNIRKPPTETRKTRIDKKHDIHIPLELQLYKMLRRQAHKQQLSMTQYSSWLVQKGLRMDISLFPELDYRQHKTMARAKLEQYYYDELFNFSLEWGYTTMRRTAHRILVEMIKRKEGSVT